uniref:Uncharacterized protein n=1 Tax=Echeneis naucrates TaxID=173247 RepID=A0A665VAF3_ECHNA
MKLEGCINMGINCFVPSCLFKVLSLAEEKPSATMSSAKQFDVSPSSTTSQPKTTTAMANTTTTTSKTTTTTPKTTTTTPKTTTTTPKTTTTTPKTTTTTPKTTTTTPKTTTTTPKTTDPPPPTRVFVGSYNLTEKKVVCLRANMALEIQLSAAKVNGSFIVQPNETKTEGSCGETKANLTLVFKEGFITFIYNKHFDYQISVADNTAYVDALSFKLSYSFAKGARQEYRADNKSLHLFAAKVSHCYSCSGEMLYMGNGLYLNVTKNRMQAFNLTKSYDFGQPDMCLADNTDYRVSPFGVGVTLLVLIVIVVLAYLVSRRKRTDGYQTL